MISRSSIQSSGHPILPLGEVVQFLDYLRKPIKESERTAGPFPYYGANGLQGTIDKFIFDEPLVLLAEDGGHFDDPDRGIAYRISGKTWVNNHAHVLRPGKRIDLDYLCRVLENYDVSPFITGTTRGKLTQAGASEIPVPLPPLPEQRRIAAILDQAEALRTKRRAALAKLDTLAQSIFIEMFGDTTINPHGWSEIPLTEMCRSDDDIKCGPFGTQLSKSEFTEEGVPLWGIRNVNLKFQLPTKEFLAPKTATRLQQYSIEPGDIVMTRKGTVGNCAVYPETFPVGIMHSDLLRLRVDPKKCEPAFLTHQLQHSREVEHQLSLISGGAIMPGINVGRLKSIQVLCPPFALQRDFASRVASTDQLKSSYRESHTGLSTLFTCLQHRAFRGLL